MADVLTCTDVGQRGPSLPARHGDGRMYRPADKLQSTFTFYGAARDFACYRGPEAILHGPAETGKTLSCLWLIHLCALRYPHASVVIARKVRDSIYPTTLQMYVHKVLKGMPAVTPYGGEKPAWFDYSNGARVWLAGLDNPGKILSAEHDLIYVNQIEELTLEDWETLITRTTGRAGHMPYARTIGDCNPSYPSHWMYHRSSLRIFYSRHEDNPVLFDPATGAMTEQGKRTMAILDALTGVRKERLRYGKPAQAEGVIYEEWDESRHLIYAEKVPQLRRFFAAQDWGYTNPGVLGVWGVDGDGRMVLLRQVYRSGKTIDWWADVAAKLQHEYGRFEAVVCDPSEPAYLAAYRRAGLNAVPANTAVLPGINAVKARLNKDRLLIMRASLQEIDEELLAARKPTCVQDEFGAYVWANRATKEEPLKADDHGMDMVRYAVMYLDGSRGWSRGVSR